MLLLIALKHNDLVSSILDHENKIVLVDTSFLRAAFEVAGATNNRRAFVRLFTLATERHHNGQIKQALFLSMLENALYWAALQQSKEVLQEILDQAFINGYALELLLARTGQRTTAPYTNCNCAR